MKDFANLTFEIPYSWFPPPHFCFLVIVALFVLILSPLLVAAVISLSLVFLMKSSSRRIDASMLSSMLRSHLFLVHTVYLFWSIYQSSSLVHFKNGPKYLTWGIIPLMRFLPQSLVSRSFLVRLKYSFLIIFSFISAYLMVSAFNIPRFL